MRTLLFAVCIASACACGGGGGLVVQDTASADRVLELGEITFIDHYGRALLKIHSDGSTEFGLGGGDGGALWGSISQPDAAVVWQPGPKLASDGTLLIDGAARLRVTVYGKVIDIQTSQPLPIVLSEDRVDVTNEAKTVSIGLEADGRLTIVGGSARTQSTMPRVDGATTPRKRRAALVLIALLLVRQTQSAPKT